MTLDDLGTALGLLIEGGTLLLAALIAVRWVITRWPSAALVTGSASPPPVSQLDDASSRPHDLFTSIPIAGPLHITDGLNPTRPMIATPPRHRMTMDLNDPGTIWKGGPQRAPHWTDVQ